MSLILRRKASFGSSVLDARQGTKEGNMNRKANARPPDDMRPEYDFSGGVRGKFYKEYMKGTNVVLLDPDVAQVFPDSRAVNEALRVLAQVAKRQAKSRPKKSKTA